MTSVLAPYAGRVLPLSDAPDPVFAAEMVGSGAAIDPERTAGTAIAPISGTLAKVHPHAFVISGPDGAVLVHLGIDTVGLGGEGFAVKVSEGDDIEAGAPVVEWDPASIADRGLSPLVLVCVLDTAAGSVTAGSGVVAAGDELFTWP